MQNCPRSLGHCWLALGLATLILPPPAPGQAAVVLTNRTARRVAFTLQPSGPPAESRELDPGWPLVLPDERPLQIQFVSAGRPQRRRLEPDAIYAFVPAAAGVALEPLFLPETGTAISRLGSPADAPPIAVIPIKLLADAGQKGIRKVWEPRLRGTIEQVGAPFEAFCRVRFQIVAVETWAPRGKSELPQSLRDFQEKVDPRPGWLAIGFSSQVHVTQPGRVPESEVGLFSTHLLVPDVQANFSEADQRLYLAHHLGHILGATHTPEGSSIFQSGYFDAIRNRPLRFDAANTLAMNLVSQAIRRYRTRSVDGLPLSVRRYLRAIYTVLGREQPGDRTAARILESVCDPLLGQARFTAAWEDGTRLSGDPMWPWDSSPEPPPLALRPLSSAQRSPLWLQDNTQTGSDPEAVVEFWGWDRLPGRVVGWRAGPPPPAPAIGPYLLVETADLGDAPAGSAATHIRVPLRWVRRIVCQHVTDLYQPSTLFCRDGRQITFRSLRVGKDSIRLLRQDGVANFPLDLIAELHLPAADGWTAYFEQLAALSPECSARLTQWETVGGLRVTSSAARSCRDRNPAGNDPAARCHWVQPAWSLDPLCLADQRVRVQRYTRPATLPLSWLQPTASRRQVWLGGAWQWRTDRNVQGGALCCAERPYQWGFGVQAASELEFALPIGARSFRTQLGLDRLAGDGGCARGSVVLAGSSVKTIYHSPLLVGSDIAIDTGELPLESAEAPVRLVLRADMAGKDSSLGADPLDIRAIFDWLEPTVTLDEQWLRGEVFRSAPRLIPAWEGWAVASGDKQGALLASFWVPALLNGPQCRLAALARTGPLVVSRWVKVCSGNQRLLLSVRPPDGSPASQIEVRADGQRLAEFEPLPRRLPAPVREISLAAFNGRQINLEIIQRAQDPLAALEWLGLALTGKDAGDVR